MSDPTPNSVRAALAAMLATIDGSGDYTLDLSGAGAVIYGLPPATGRPAGHRAYIFRGEARYTRGTPATLGGWHRVGSWGLTLLTPSSSTAPADREAGLDSIERDLMDAIDAALLTGGALADAGVLDVTDVALRPVFGSQPGASVHPVAVDATLQITYLRGRA